MLLSDGKLKTQTLMLSTVFVVIVYCSNKILSVLNYFDKMNELHVLLFPRTTSEAGQHKYKLI